jgi:uncharacterized membrane protein YkvA (DUF1232 family)
VSLLQGLLLVGGALLVLYGLLIGALIVAGRQKSLGAFASFVPDCIVLVSRLLGDPHVPRRHKLVLGVLVGYLVLPFDLVPDFIPVAGQLDDAIVVALVLRAVLRAGGVARLQEHWPGPDSSLAVLLRLIGLSPVPA